MRASFILSTILAANLGFGCSSSDECIGHACPDPLIELPEGGEIRLELVYWEHNLPEVRAHAWFASGQDPETRPWPRSPQNWLIQDGPDLCADMRQGSFFPSGLVNSRDYVDAGDHVVFESEDSEILLERRHDAQDTAVDIFHDIVYLNDVPFDQVQTGAEYDFRVSGSSDFPEQTFEQALFVPPDYEITFPDMSQNVILPNSGDFRFFWDSISSNVLDFAFVSFADRYGPVGFCIGPQSGFMTIPESFIASLPQSGEVLHGVINHRVIERDERKMDFVGINCRQSRYVIDSGL